MLSAIRPSHRHMTPMTRVTDALPDLPHPHLKRHRRVGAAVITRAVVGLLALLIGTAVVILRNKLTFMVGSAPAPDAAEE